jgi:DNA helicase-2/ATP-dependent DNA helicase PcrA
MWQSSIPSRFVGELPEEHVEIKSDQGLWGAVTDAADLAMADINYGRGPSRFSQNRRSGGMLLEGQGVEVETPRAGTNFKVGGRVFHQKFGYGRIAAVDGAKLEIDFEHSGRKKVMDSFVEPA